MQPINKDQYAQAHADLQPRGLAWSRKPSSVRMKLYAGFARLYVELHSALILLTRELDPRGASQLLSEWEAFVGLPDACTLVAGTESERRAAVHAKLTSTGGASASYFIQLADALGYPGATVTEFPVRRFGRSRFGGRFHGRTWRNVWQLNLIQPGATPRRFSDRFGGHYLTSGNTVLECRVFKLKPSHTRVLFHYGA
jgi:uncharacterized protein YmfQ (DUF2313 family)